jgi:polar amino acid transport system substrate-binding protein
LLVFYFGIFGKININPIVVSILAFSIYFSAYVVEILKGAYSSINRIQIDSAYALGFTKIQTIRYIIIPQILCYVIPVYKNESVSLIKSTSIAGYISIIDLTKASDIIRNRTYEPFFPLVFTAFIYFTICYLFSKTLDFIYKKINPRMEKKYGK